jgi:MFS transporter, DHA3 family, macrolide efflux protein
MKTVSSPTATYQPPSNGWRTFLVVWFTQSISVFGSELTFFALSVWMMQTLYPRPDQKAELALALSLQAMSAMIPRLLLMPFAGAWADRHDRKRTMMVMDFANGLLSGLLAVLVITNRLNLPVLLFLLVLHAIIGVFHNSAFDASYAMLVPEKKLGRANGMMMSIWSLSGIISPMIAATIVALPALLRQSGATGPIAQLPDGTSLAMAIDSISFFLASGALIFLTIPSPQRSDLFDAAGRARKSMWADVQEGARYIWYRRPMLWLLGTFAVVNLLGSPVGVFQRLFLKFNLASDWLARGMSFEAALALLATVGSIGGLAGGLLISTWGGLKQKRIYGVIIPIMISAAAMIGLGFSAGLIMAASMAFTASAMNPIMNAHSQTIWQIQTPRELQGRVFSVRRLIAQFTSPLGVALAGWVGGQFDPGLVIAALGIVLLVFSTAQLFNRSLLRVEDKAWLDAMADEREAQRPSGIANDLTLIVGDALPEDSLRKDVTA